MSNGTEGTHISRMIAKADDPWLSVHSIAEYVFCPRAGLIAHENQRVETDEPPAFDTLPRFEIEAVEAELQRQMQYLFRYLWAIFLVAAISPFAVYLQQHGFLVLIGVAMLFITWQCLSILSVVHELQHRKKILLESKCIEPNPYSKDMQPINWFGLLNLGFQSQTLQDSLEDAIWNFRGKPWRLLIRGDLIVPVFKTRSKTESPSHPQITKIMAYCRLVSVHFKCDCSYGVIITNEDYSGFAVPNDGYYRKRFHDGLVDLRNLAQATHYGKDTEVDYQSHKCHGCHLGRPRLVTLGQRVVRNGAPVTPNQDFEGMHSDCGDRFEWCPPYRH